MTLSIGKSEEVAKRMRDGIDRQSPPKKVCNSVDYRITEAAISRALYFRASQPLAVISGAGIAGLAASFELRARGFNVVVVEKRERFSRFNVINLNIETQAFLKKFNLLENFEKFVAARIKEHRYVLVDKSNSTRRLGVSDVSGLRFQEPVDFEPENFDKLFEQDGIYSVPIEVLQTFLAEHALDAGVNILGNTTVRVLARTQGGGVAKAQITYDRIVEPDLFFVAEGAHSSTARDLGMRTKQVTNACTGENWIFGNMSYTGSETFVVSLIDASQKTIRIANVIFNSKSHVINIAVTTEKGIPEERIREQILQTAQQAFAQQAFPVEEIQSELLTTVGAPVHVENRAADPFSIGNVFCIGDTAGCSSPLAGLGGTLGLTLVPRAVGKLLDDYQGQSSNIHSNFDRFTEAYTTRWMQKSEGIKKFCISIFEKEQSIN